MKKMFFFFLIPIFFVSANQNPEWLFEDAFDKEIVLLDEVSIVTPDEIRDALVKYHAGQYRFALEQILKIRRLNLPDGKLDFTSFVLAECYRQLDLDQNALKEYYFVARNFPESDKVAPSLYRLLEYAVEQNNEETADSLFMIFQNRYRIHPLHNSAIFIFGKFYYVINRFGEAIQLLSQVSKQSSRYIQAQFLLGLCHINLGDTKKALSLLEYVKTTSLSNHLAAEASLLIGDIYSNNDSLSKALVYYNSVPENTSQFQIANVKITRAKLMQKQYEAVFERGNAFLKKFPNNDYFFEMASLLEQAYEKSGKAKEAARIEEIIHRQIVDARLLFEIYEEIDRLADIVKSWQIIEYEAIRVENKSLLDHSRKNISKAKDLENRFRKLLAELQTGENAELDNRRSVPLLAERRYINILKKRNEILVDSITQVKSDLELDSIYLKSKPDSVALKSKVDSLSNLLKRFSHEFGKNEHEYNLVVKECIGAVRDGRQADEEMQAKFVDWTFTNYQKKKEMLRDLNLELASQKAKIETKNQVAGIDSITTDTTTNFTNISIADRERLKNEIIDDRMRLKGQIETMLDVYPKNKFNSQIYFRLAELYYDAAGDDFEKKLRKYEQAMTETNDSTGLEFPEYNLDEVIKIYDIIVQMYPRDDLADNACFYKSLALQKIGLNDDANDALLELIEKYPESEFFVEANMNIGRYYFDHPKADDGQGYKLAEDAYRKVLYYRDHPQFVQALYHLGWCYYMQDRYEDAIAVFKYLVEEVDLDFDPSLMEDKQVVNPLLRAEAIDYIAISFDEDGRIDDAVKFLQLIGNNDYSAMVIKRIGELREEDLDYSAAASIYRRLLAEYPFSTIAPDAMVRLLKIYEGKESSDTANDIRNEFFNTYSSGSKWQTEIIKKDTLMVKKIDSMAISIGLFIADASYRNSEITNNYDDYHLAATHYEMVVDKYPKSKKAADAMWNLAVIMSSKLNKKPEAYDQFVRFSKLTVLDSVRREQASLNAVEIAQSLLSTDSTSKKGQLDFAARKVIEAVQNYCTLFPDGQSTSQVLLNSGAVYFNRRMFENAIEQYEKIINKGPGSKDYYTALLLSAQCYFGQDKWQLASDAFKKVWKGSNDGGQTAEAVKLLLQSEFLYAKSLLIDKDYANAAIAFRHLEDQYPGSAYGDIALYNAAEAYEKQEKWILACDNYYLLATNYPYSKLAADALFNAAGNFEKADKYAKAAEAYELLISKYSQSEKAKDALFNLGFCYEKLGKMDEMAEANEKYSSLYPGEKDVESLLLRTATYYMKTGLYEKAIAVHKNFVRRFPNSPKCIEALFNIAKCYYDQKDIINAVIGFNQTEQQNLNFIRDGLESNNFYASEAAYFIASIKRNQFLEIKLQQPDDKLKISLKNKSDLLSDAAKAYQRVIQYQSEKMFEAAYRIGLLYEDLAEACRLQERPRLDPINAAVFEKDVFNLSAQLLQKTFIPYKKSRELVKGFDSLTTDQILWAHKSDSSLLNNYYKAGVYLMNAAEVMQGAPVPKEIREQPLHNYQYLKKLYETVEPMKISAMNYYSTVLDQIDSLGFKGALVDSCRNAYAHVNFLIGDSYDKLAIDILQNTQNLPKDMSEDDKDELLFQLEDIIFELQDKVILFHETALKNIQEKSLHNSNWFVKIFESLARLSPEKYGTSFFQTIASVSGSDWIMRGDSIAKWNSAEPSLNGWVRAVTENTTTIKNEKLDIISGDKAWNRMYLWKNLFLPGVPRNASVFIAATGVYRLFINGILTLSDSIGNADITQIDSAVGITVLLKGGDNVLAIESQKTDTADKRVAVYLTALVDTSKHYASSIRRPKVTLVEQEIKPSISPMSGTFVTKDNEISDKNTPVQKFRNKAELQKAIDVYNLREQMSNDAIKKERLEIQKLRMKLEELDKIIKQKQDRKVDIQPENSTHPDSTISK